jgi:hypothetical protein
MKNINKNEVIAIIVGLGIVGLWMFFGTRVPSDKPVADELFDPRNATYIIEDQPVTLVDGRSEVPLELSSGSKIITQYFGNGASGDINGDGVVDIAFLLTQSSGGSGTFYYIVAVLGGRDEHHPTNTVFLGDRIAPQSTEVRDGKLIVNFAERNPGEGMTTAPSVGVSKYFEIKDGLLVESK